MSWRFRKSFKVLPGVRLNVSKGGISTSIGGSPMTLNFSQRGVRSTVSVPGTGFSFQHTGSNGPIPTGPPSSSPPDVLPPAPLPAPKSVDLGEEIRSAGSDLMTSAGLTEFRKLLLQSGKECVELSTELAKIGPLVTRTRARHGRWERGFLLRRIRKAKFAEITEHADTHEAHQSELQEQLRLARLATEITVEPEIATAYAQVCDAFAAMSQATCIWDTLTRKATNRVAERTTASESITRERVTFQRGQSDILTCEWAVPVLENRSGGDLYLYPAFVLYRVTSDTFAVIDVQDVAIDYVPTRFIEREAIPSDSRVVGHTWLKANKDGSPDKRFKGNAQIPVVQYGTLTLKSSTGLNEEYMLSSAPLSEAFAKAWTRFRQSFAQAGPVH